LERLRRSLSWSLASPGPKIRLAQATDDLVVIPVEMLAVAFLVLLLALAFLWAVRGRVPCPARISGVRSDVGFQRRGRDAARRSGHDDRFLVVDPNAYLVVHGTSSVECGRNV
jgi:hypothetical protein